MFMNAVQTTGIFEGSVTIDGQSDLQVLLDRLSGEDGVTVHSRVDLATYLDYLARGLRSPLKHSITTVPFQRHQVQGA